MASQPHTLKRLRSGTSSSFPSLPATRPRIDTTPTLSETTTVVASTAPPSCSPTTVNSPSPPPVFTHSPPIATPQSLLESDTSIASASEESDSESRSDDTIRGEETDNENDADFLAREDRDINILRHLGVLFPGSSYGYGLPPPEPFDETILDEPIYPSDLVSDSEPETDSESEAEPESESDSTITSSSNDSSDSEDSDNAQKLIAYCRKPLPFHTLNGILNSDSSNSDSESDSTPCPLPLPPRRVAPNTSSLQSRLTSFLPALKSANEALERERQAGTLGERDIENVKEEEGKYIEMELGLGVLEQKGDEDGDSESEDDDNDERTKKEEGDEVDRKQLNEIPMQRPRARSQKGVLDPLMGKSRFGAKPAIEVL